MQGPNMEDPVSTDEDERQTILRGYSLVIGLSFITYLLLSQYTTSILLDFLTVGTVRERLILF